MITTSILLLLLLTLATARRPLHETPPGSIALTVVNHAGAPIEVYWVNIYEPGEPLQKQSEKPLRNSSETELNSYDTHEFVIKFLHDIPGAWVRFVKGPKVEKVVINYDKQTNNMTATVTTKFDELVDSVSDAMSKCTHLSGAEFADCIARLILEDVERVQESKAIMEQYRDVISNRLRNYTCADPMMATTDPISIDEVYVGDQKFEVSVMLDMPNAKIWTVENFISNEECDILMEHGGPRLRRATVADEDGTSVVSENRKAQQASYDIFRRGVEDPLWPLYERVLGMTNVHGGFELHPDGQEDFTIIQYNENDQYSPHCDGGCDGAQHRPAGRVATGLLYCKVAERGGATTFTKADVLVNPKKNMAVFFTYKGPDGRMDEGYTEHSGCPVLQGEKWITTVWMREGVTEQRNWRYFDPQGLPILDLKGFNVGKPSDHVDEAVSAQPVCSEENGCSEASSSTRNEL